MYTCTAVICATEYELANTCNEVVVTSFWVGRQTLIEFCAAAHVSPGVPLYTVTLRLDRKFAPELSQALVTIKCGPFERLRTSFSELAGEFTTSLWST